MKRPDRGGRERERSVLRRRDADRTARAQDDERRAHHEQEEHRVRRVHGDVERVVAARIEPPERVVHCERELDERALRLEEPGRRRPERCDRGLVARDPSDVVKDETR